MKKLKEHIVKVSGGYRLVSKKTGKNLGTYPSKAGAEKREKQVQYFKHMKEEKQDTNKDKNKLVRDRVTGKLYDPHEEFNKLFKDREFVDQMKRMGREEGKGWPKRKEQNVKEEKQVPHPDILPPSGAGNDGSKEVVHSYTKDTPGQIVKKIKTFKQYTK